AARLRSQGSFSAIVVADPHGVVDGGDEDLAVAELAGTGGVAQSLHGLIQAAVGNDDLELHLREQIDGVLLAAIDLAMALLASMPADVGDGHAIDADFLEGFADILQLVGLNDGFDFLHTFSLRSRE